MESLVKKIKTFKQETYSEFTGESYLSQLDEALGVESGLIEVMGYLDKAQVTEATFNPESAGLKTAEGFIFKFLTKLIERDPESTIPLICEYL